MNQPFSGNYDRGQATQWIKGVGTDPEALIHLSREVFGQISNLDQTQRQQVFTALRNDVKFKSVIEDLMPQTT